jgi:DNA end-binding protein Ku
MPPRSLWTGTISFGLVNVPVRMYSAIDEHTLHFHMLHEKDDSRIGYEKVCKKEGKPVPDDEIVKAFEFEKGEYVYMTDEDFDEAKVEGYKTIDIRDFVPYEEIDPIFFRKTYYLGPQDGAERTYALLREAMERSGLAAIAKFIMRDRQNLGCLRVREGVITLEQMYFADEVRSIEEIAPGKAKVDAKELKMAEALIDSYSGAFEPGKYEDTYRDTLCEIINAKRKGKDVHIDRGAQEEEAPPDLMSALRASVEAARGGKASRANGGKKRRAASDGLADLSKDELYERAKKADIPGRAKMSKEELLDALERAA